MQTFNSLDNFTQACIKHAVQLTITKINENNSGDFTHTARKYMAAFFTMTNDTNVISDEMNTALDECINSHVKLTFVE